MHVNVKKVIGLLCCSLLFNAAFVWGQGAGTFIKVVDKAPTAWRGMKSLPKPPRVVVPRTSALPSAHVSAGHNAFAKNCPNLYIMYQKNINGLSHTGALRKLVEARGLKPLTPWPTTENFVVVTDLDELLIGRSLENRADRSSVRGMMVSMYAPENMLSRKYPDFPFPSNKIDLYRGMALNEAGIRNVLQNGIRIEDVAKNGTQSNTMDFLFGKELRQLLVKERVSTPIWATPNSETAASYAVVCAEGETPVVVRIRGYQNLKDDPAVVLRAGEYRHFTISRDVPVQDIEVSVLVKGPEGIPAWCRILLAEDGQTLVLEPYIVK